MPTMMLVASKSDNRRRGGCGVSVATPGFYRKHRDRVAGKWPKCHGLFTSRGISEEFKTTRRAIKE